MKVTKMFTAAAMFIVMSVNTMSVQAAVPAYTSSSNIVKLAAANENAPNPKIEYKYTTSAKRGTIRYISQYPKSKNFHSDYWGKWSALHECGTASMSMALSYIGIAVSPNEILTKYNGSTKFDSNWGGIDPTKDYSKKTGTSFDEAWDKYASGDGQYSPPIIHIPKNNYYYLNGHFMLAIGKNADGSYKILDPYDYPNSAEWNATISDGKIKIQLNGKPAAWISISDIRQYHKAKYNGEEENEPEPEAPKEEDTTELAKISDATYPSKIVEGSAFSLKGIIESKSVITKVSVAIKNSKDENVFVKSVKPNEKKYSIAKGIDALVKFGGFKTGEYKYIVKATNAAGTKTLLSKTFYVIPKATEILSLENKTSGITVTWKQTDGVTGYIIYKKSGKNKYEKLKTVKGGEKFSYTDKKAVKENETYSYKIYTYKNDNGITVKSAVSPVKSYIRVSAPQNLKLANPKTMRLRINYKKVAKASFYNIQYGTSKDFSTARNIEVDKYKNLISTTKKNKMYYVRVRTGVKKGKNIYYSAWSKTATIKIK